MIGLLRGSMVAVLVAGGTVVLSSVASAAPEPLVVHISEIHYDNAGTDEGEAIEVAGPAGTDLTGWSLVLYNGSNGSVYDTDALSGTIPSGGSIVVNYAVNGIQNGSPDGIALVRPDATVAEFLSYEGAFTGVGGPADGQLSIDIGASQSGSDAVGLSLQLSPCAGNSTWTLAASTFGSANAEPVGGCDGEPPAPPFISEIHYDNAGADANEAIEVTGQSGTDLTGWTLVLYNGSTGEVYASSTLPGVIPGAAGELGAVAVAATGLQNGAPDGIALVRPDATVVEFISYEGSFTGVGGAANGVLSTDIGVVEDGTTSGADQSLQRSPAGVWSGPRCASFGSVNDPDAPTTCGPTEPPPPTIVKIHEVQGSGLASPLVGQAVVIEAVVTDDREGTTPAGGMRGFFLQEEAADHDADPATSEGLFVFNANNDNVNVGDLVRVSGTVVEFGGLTELSTITNITVVSSGHAAPAPVIVEFPVTTVAALEAYEGMIASFPQSLVIAEYFNYDRFGEVVVALPADGEARPMSPTAVFAPDSPEAAARLDLNQRSRITIDDGISTQNPENLIHPITRTLFGPGNTFRGGDTVTGLTGPITEGFSLYRILPFGGGAGYSEFSQTPAPASPDPVGGSLRVASMNTLNYFLTIDGGSATWVCGPTQTMECRGADTADELARQRVKLLNALEGLDADVIGLNELENTPGVEPLADIVAGLNDRFGAGTYAFVAAGNNSVVGTDAIKVGLVYRPAAVTPVGATAVLDTPEFLDPLATGVGKNRAAVAQSFVDNATGEVFSVTINHLKSKGSACGEPGEAASQPLTGNCNLTRTASAQVLADWIAGSPTGIADTDWLIMGDLNSYDHEAPIGVLESAGYTDLAKAYHGEFAYSYVFDGMSGYLDYSLASPSMNGQVTGMTDWHINADEPDVVDYDMTFKGPYQDSLFDPNSPARSSDHDAVVVGLDLHSNVSVSASPSIILLPLRQMVTVNVTAKGTPGETYTAVVTGAMSSEADSGLGRFDLPNDIQITNGTIKVRAEVFACPARTYTIDVVASGGGQVVYRQVETKVVNLLLLVRCWLS